MFSRIRNLFAPPKPIAVAESPSPAAQDEYQLQMQAAFDAYQRRDFAAARVVLQRIAERLPRDTGAMQMLGAVYLAEERPRDAHRVLKEACALAPDNFELAVASAQAAAKASENLAALEAYRAAIRMRPDFVKLYAVTGDVCEQLGRVDDAIHFYRQGIDVDPRYSAGWLNLGCLLDERDRLDEAADCFDRVLMFDPKSAKAHFNRGLVLQKRKRQAEAEAAYRRALELDPKLQMARLQLGVVLYDVGRIDEANVEFSRCDAPNAARAHCMLASVAVCKRDLAEADRHYALAAEAAVEDEEACNDIAAVLLWHGRVNEAEALLRRAVTKAGGYPRAEFNLALVDLGRGRFAEGWAKFDRRFELAARAVPTRPHMQPRWRGEPIAGKHLLVWTEQGIGDEIIFASLFAELQSTGARVTIECHSKLMPLFARSFPWAKFVARTTPPPPKLQIDVDVQIPAGSLGPLYRPGLESFPGRRPYLVADPERVRRWRERVSALGAGPKIGFSWRSSNLKNERALACTRLEEWRPLFSIPNVHWVCLQYDDCAAELESVARDNGVVLHRFDDVDYFDDLDEVAALMSALDLVISAPTSVSIQSAALDIDTWLMTYGSDWQTHGTQGMPWLPAIVRHERRWDQTWDDVLERLADNLRDWVASKRAVQPH